MGADHAARWASARSRWVAAPGGPMGRVDRFTKRTDNGSGAVLFVMMMPRVIAECVTKGERVCLPVLQYFLENCCLAAAFSSENAEFFMV